MIYTSLVTLLVVLEVPGHVESQSGTDVNTLLTDLFTTNSYNKKVRPLINQTAVLDISVDFFLTSVIEFDEQNEAIKTSGHLTISWVDEYLQWTPSSYNNISEIFIPQDDIWKPDISLRNSFITFTGLGSSYLNVEVDYNGTVQWNPFQVLESTCSVDTTYFPFDSQTCELKFVAWSYHKDDVNLNEGSSGMMLREYQPNNHWDIKSTAARETNDDEASVYFSMTLKRKPRFYTINIIIPVILLTVLNCCTFVLPVASDERAGYSITVFLSMAVFLTIVASELPKNSTNTSLLATYLMLMTSLSTMIVILCLVEVRISRRTIMENRLNKVYMFVYSLSRLLQCKSRGANQVNDSSDRNENSEITGSEVKNTDKSDDNVSWMDIVNALDVVFFWICMTFTFISTLVIFVTASQG